MSKHRLFYEIVSLHLVTWWGIRILSSQTTFMHTAVENTPEWYAVRLVRAIITILPVLVWACWRNIAWHELGLGKQGFWRNYVIAFGLIVFLWVAIVIVRGTPLLAPRRIAYPARFWAAITGLIDVLAQQLSTFGLLQSLGSQHVPRPAALLLALLSFGLAHYVIASPPMVIVAFVIGLIFGLSLWRTGNLGLGLGVHFGFYFMLAILGWGA